MIPSEIQDELQMVRNRKATDLLASTLVQTHGAETWKASLSPTVASSPSGAKASTLTKLPFGLVCMSPK